MILKGFFEKFRNDNEYKGNCEVDYNVENCFFFWRYFVVCCFIYGFRISDIGCF